VGQEHSEGVGGQEDEDSDGAGLELHEHLEGSDQEHHGGFAYHFVAGSVSRHRWFRRSHIVAPPVVPHPDNRVLIIPCGDG
jgi:hypothetical protein